MDNCNNQPSNADNWISGDWIADTLGCPYKIIGSDSLDYVQGETFGDVVEGQEYHVEWDIIIPKELNTSGYEQNQCGNIFSSKTGDVLAVYRSIKNDNTKKLEPYILIDLGEFIYREETAPHRSYHRLERSPV